MLLLYSVHILLFITDLLIIHATQHRLDCYMAVCCSSSYCCFVT